MGTLDHMIGVMADPTISIVVPAYNEEASIRECIESLAEQLDNIDELIVVNNNSTDATGEILAELSARIPKMRVLREETPGIIPVRNTGFDAARSEIIARVDADVVVRPGWAREIKRFFAVADPSYGAIFGAFDQYDMPFQGLHRKIIDGLAKGAADHDGVVFRDYSNLMGANMAIRASVWASVRASLSSQRDILEDLDLALCLQDREIKIAFVPAMFVSVSGRRMLTTPRSYWKFTAQVPRTVRMRRGFGAKYLSSVASVTAMRAMQLALWAPSRSYDPATGRFSISTLLAPYKERPIPDGTDRA